MTGPDQPVTTAGRVAGIDTPEVVAVDQPFDADGLYSLRSTLAAHATRLAVPPMVVERLLIVASELATNAVRHGGGTGRLRLWRDGTTLYCQISDHGPGIGDSTVGIKPPEPMAAGGRGMWISRQLCDDLVITNTGRGATVTAIMNVHPSHPDPALDRPEQ